VPGGVKTGRIGGETLKEEERLTAIVGKEEMRPEPDRAKGGVAGGYREGATYQKGKEANHTRGKKEPRVCKKG